tara:strand:- start:395 stop:811 length:417 start_codon:yes stop_codon:yes gene_type:complete
MKKTFLDIVKISFKNKLIKPYDGAISYKKASYGRFYITGNNILNKKLNPDIHTIFVEREYYGINEMTRRNVTKDINLHGFTMIKHFDEDIVLLQPTKDLIEKLSDESIEVLDLENKFFLKSSPINMYNFLLKLKIDKK